MRLKKMNKQSVRYLTQPLLIATLMAWLAALSAAQAWAQDAPDEKLLKVEAAFQLSVAAIAPDLIHAEWRIADGYFMYRDKFRFRSETPGVVLGEPIFPKGKLKHDDFFGDVETYRDSVAVDIPVTFSGGAEKTSAAAEWAITATYQGCADRGVCYPPHNQTVAFQSIAMTTAPEPTESGGVLGALTGLTQKLGFGKKKGEFLPVDEAFVISGIVATDAGALAARWDIAEGYYLYRNKFSFKVLETSDVTLGAPDAPAGEFKQDDAFGRMEVYHNRVELRIPYTRTSTNASEVTIEAHYQGCAEKGFCYPPQIKNFKVSLPAGQSVAASNNNKVTASSTGFVSEQDQLVARLAGGNKMTTIALFFGFGLLLAFTPCVFPMIPILSSIIVGQGHHTSTRRAFSLSLAYVLPMALTYTVAGVVAGLTGANLQAAFQNAWVIGTFSFIFVLLALSMFGFYNLQIPTALQTRLSMLSNQQKGGTLLGAGIMGFFSALIVGPCVAAPLAAALIYIAQTKDAWLGGAALLSLSLGMGAPLLIIGTSAGKLLPRVGDWMNAVKAVFGVLLLGVAVWMLERIMPIQFILLLWSILAITSAAYLGALRRLDNNATGWQKLWQGLGVVLLIYGAILLVSAASGGRDILAPLEHLSAARAATTSNGATAQPAGLAFKRIKGLDGLNAELKAASARGQYVMLDFYADWCVSCKELEHYTFNDAGVKNALSNVLLLQADVTADDAQDQALRQHFGVFGPPAILFFDPAGAEREEFRIIGLMKPEQFIPQARLALGARTQGI